MPDLDPERFEKFPGWPRVGGGSGDAPAAGGSDAPAAPAADGGTGEPGGDDAPIDLAQVAADIDAEALASLPPEGDDKGEGPGKGKGEAPRTPASADPVDAFIQQNYGGDKAAFVASLHESRREAKRLADQVAVLEARSKPAETRDVMAEFKAERDSSAEIQAIDQEIKVIDSRVLAVDARQRELVGLATKLNNEIVELDATLPHIEDQKEWAKSYAKLSRLRTELTAHQGEFNTNEARKEQFGLRKSQAQRELVRAENDIKRSMISEEEQKRIDAANDRTTRSAFASGFDSAIKEYGLDPTSETYIYMRDATRTQLADYLGSLGEDADGLDAAGIYEAVGKLVKAGAKAFKLQPKSPTPTKPRTPITPRPLLTPKAPARSASDEVPVRQPARPRNSEELLEDPDYVRRRAEQVFAASGREALRRNRTGLG